MARKVVEREFAKVGSSWTSSYWDEYDWLDRIKEIELRDILEARRNQLIIAHNCQCLKCPNFVKHVGDRAFATSFQETNCRQFAMCHDEWLIQENIVALRQLMSDQNLQLLPDYEQRILVLKDLGFVDESSRVELKGKVACEVCHSVSLYAQHLAWPTDPFRRRVSPHGAYT